jgi:RNA polymerase sigma-70 factor (ECF subfamily)
MNKPIFSEKELFELVARGDIQAFERLFRLYYPVLARVLMRYSRDPEQIKDWIQEIYIKLWENRESAALQGAENSKAYFIVSARNHVIRLLNKKKQIHLIFDDSVHERHIADHSMENNMRGQELMQAYQQALSKMPPRTREAFSLNREQGMAYSKVADQQGTSVKTVEAQISRAISILRRELVTFFQ